MAEHGRGAFAKLLPFLANHDRGPACKLRGPGLSIAIRAPDRTRDQARIGFEVLVEADIDHHRRMRRADQS